MCKYAERLRLTCLLSPRRRFRPAQRPDLHGADPYRSTREEERLRKRIGASATRSRWSSGPSEVEARASAASFHGVAVGVEEVLMSRVMFWSLQDPDPPGHVENKAVPPEPPAPGEVSGSPSENLVWGRFRSRTSTRVDIKVFQRYQRLTSK